MKSPEHPNYGVPFMVVSGVGGFLGGSALGISITHEFDGSITSTPAGLAYYQNEVSNLQTNDRAMARVEHGGSLNGLANEAQVVDDLNAKLKANEAKINTVIAKEPHPQFTASVATEIDLGAGLGGAIALFALAAAIVKARQSSHKRKNTAKVAPVSMSY